MNYEIELKEEDGLLLAAIIYGHISCNDTVNNLNYKLDKFYSHDMVINMRCSLFGDSQVLFVFRK